LKEEFGACSNSYTAIFENPQFDFLGEGFAQYLNYRLRAQ